MTEQPERPAWDADEREALLALGWRRSATGSLCPDSALLVALEEGVLDDQTAARVRDHLAACTTCQWLVGDLKTVLADASDADAAARIRSRIPDTRPTSRPRTFWWIGAGALAAAAAIVWFMVMPRSSPPPVPDSQLARVTPAPIPSVFVVGRPTIPPADLDLTVRGEASTRVTLENQIAAALDKADKGDLMVATSDLKALVKGHSASRIAALALGAVQLRAGQNADAVATLGAARAMKGDVPVSDELGWFLGIALVRTGHADQARATLDDVCKHQGPRGASACAGVAEIDRAGK